MRLDKWLWAARFYKTRALAVDDIDKNRVQVNGQAAKPSRDVRVGDSLVMRQGPVVRTVAVLTSYAVFSFVPASAKWLDQMPCVRTS